MYFEIRLQNKVASGKYCSAYLDMTVKQKINTEKKCLILVLVLEIKILIINLHLSHRGARPDERSAAALREEKGQRLLQHPAPHPSHLLGGNPRVNCSFERLDYS